MNDTCGFLNVAFLNVKTFRLFVLYDMSWNINIDISNRSLCFKILNLLKFSIDIETCSWIGGDNYSIVLKMEQIFEK